MPWMPPATTAASAMLAAIFPHPGIGNGSGRYFMPMVATYTIRMQSNPFLHNPKKASEKWAAPNNLKKDC